MSRLDGRDEPILFPDLPIIDAHHHLIDSGSDRYLFEDYHADVTAGHNVVASVYVELGSMARVTGPRILRPLGEVEFANGVAAMSASGRYGPAQVAAAIVGHADLGAGPDVAELLDRALAVAPERFRGVRQVAIERPLDIRVNTTVTSDGGLLGNERFRCGFAELDKRGLSFEAAVLHHQLDDVLALARAFPSTTIVLNHMAGAPGMGSGRGDHIGLFREWRAGLNRLAASPNVVCKIGGLGMPVWGFSFESEVVTSRELAAAWQPFVETAIAAFGVDRCMMESNFPMDGATCGYVPLWNALKQTVASCTEHELAALFHGTAARTYRMTVDNQQVLIPT